MDDKNYSMDAYCTDGDLTKEDDGDDYDYSLDGYVHPELDEYLRQIEKLKAEREEKERIQIIAQMFLQYIIKVILQESAKTEGAEEKFANIKE